MSLRISELAPHGGTVPGTALLEIALPDGSSETGYVSRRINRSQLASAGLMPYRYPIEDTDVAVIGNGDPYYAFYVDLDLEQMEQDAIMSNPTGDFLRMQRGVIDFSFVGLTENSSESSDYQDGMFTCKTSLSFAYQLTSRSYSFSFTSDATGMIVDQNNYPAYDQDYDFLPYIIDVADGGTGANTLRVLFGIRENYVGGPVPMPEKVMYKGFIDATVILERYSPT